MPAARLAMPVFTGTVTASIELFNRQAALEHRVREMKIAQDRRDYRSVEPIASSLLAGIDRRRSSADQPDDGQLGGNETDIGGTDSPSKAGG
ncbi:hypothetical protein [Defluviicoccus vanus]|uniref:Uncharacterized protein n=1 Tax=Defluviicoccus vanus TaxID=111831 RepID=A0A7H1MXW8_9PROT|nr:hypothetical protein [Defluviicoccus vanus]QNT68304.1 hypothetical protein HQ394_01670 [Defluviicoccus vanus]